MAITAQELAERCGVSRGTVDRALKNRPGINAETRKRIFAVAERYGYRPNFIGRALSSGRTQTIGLVLFDFRHDFFAELYSIFEEEADKFQYVTFPVLSHRDPARERECLRRLVDRKVDGIAVLSVNRGEDYARFLHSLRIPVVALANRLGDAFPFSGLDDRGAADEAVRYLAAGGARRVFYYAPPLRHAGAANFDAQERRRDGWEDTCGRLGLAGACHVERETLLAALVPGDAVLASSDFYAMDLQLALRERHPRLDRDVKLMGFDGLPMLRLAQPAIASVTCSRREWANAAFAQLNRLLSGEKKVDDVVVRHWIVESDRMEDVR